MGGESPAATNLGIAAKSQATSWAENGGFGIFLLIIATVLAYQPVWSAGYIWDDDLMLTSNPCIIGPLGLGHIWTTQAADICPLTLTTFWLEHAAWGLAALPYHLVNLALHAANACLLWRVLLALRIPGAWLGAALWALHPVQVESVAWISEMKNTESGLFYLLAVLIHVKSLRQPVAGNRDYLLIFACAALAMAAKTSTMVLPFVLALCAWWVEGRWNRRSLSRLAPLLLLSLAAALLSIWTQGEKTSQPEWNRTWPERLATAGDAVWFYLGKLAWPDQQALIYPRWHIDATSVAAFLPLLAVVPGMVLLCLTHRPWARAALFAFSYFLIALFPVLGLANTTYSRYSFVADHFQYLASMGPLALAAAGLVRGAAFLFAGGARVPSSALAGMLVLVLGTLTWFRGWAFQNSETIWTDTLAKNPACWEGHLEMGVVLNVKGQLEAAEREFRRSIELNPHYFKAHYNLASVLQAEGQIEAAISELRQAIVIEPGQAQVHYGLGLALLQKGEIDAAIDELQKAVEIAPDFAPAYNGLGLVYTQKGQMDEAIQEYQKAIGLNPNYAEAHSHLGILFAQAGRIPDAVAQFEDVVRLQPDSSGARENLERAEAMLQQGNSQPH
jgi:tetratricopeptide (TPR) repeat protein